MNYPDGLEHENAIDALAATRFLAVQAFTRKLDGAGIAVHPSLCTEQWLTYHIRNKNTLRQPDDDILAALKKFNEKYPFTEWWTTVVRYLWRFNGVNFDTTLAYCMFSVNWRSLWNPSQPNSQDAPRWKRSITPPLSPAATTCVTIAVSLPVRGVV